MNEAGALLVVTAVEAERRAGLAALQPTAGRPGVSVIAAGVGPAAAAAGTARALALAEAAGQPYRGVLSAGIAGGFAGRVRLGGTVLAERSVAADLGAASPDGFTNLDELGFGSATITADPALLTQVRATLPDAVVGTVLTLTTVTGTAAGAQALLDRHPGAIAEAMEGFGVATAATQAGVAFVELRTISNLVGPRDRDSWRVTDALDALTAALAAALAALAAALTGR